MSQMTATTEHPVVGHFKSIVKSSLEDSLPVLAVNALLRVMDGSKAQTLHGFVEEIKEAQLALQAYTEGQDLQTQFGRGSALPLTSGCEIFVHDVTRSIKESAEDFKEYKAFLVERGKRFAELCGGSRSRIAELGRPFIRDGATVLVHGTSRVVAALLVAAAQNGQQFSVVQTECSGGPVEERRGVETNCALYRRSGVPVTLCPDAAVASIVEQVDLCLVGAEAVVESGGVINRTGTFQLGIVCQATNTPLYVAAESVKFARLFPLNQQDLPPSVLANYPNARKSWEILSSPGVELHAPKCDYTPAKYITLLFTDLGVLTPAAVSDELIKLYQ